MASQIQYDADGGSITEVIDNKNCCHKFEVHTEHDVMGNTVFRQGF